MLQLNGLITWSIVIFDSLNPDDFKGVFDNSVMCDRPANKKHIYSDVYNDFDKVKAFLNFVGEFVRDPESNLNRLFDRTSELHINGMGPFLVSQFLAGAHPKEYTIIEDKMVNTMKNLGLIDTKVKSDTARGYLYINDVCKNLYNEVFNKKIKEHKDNLGSRFVKLIDEDFSLIVIHEFFWEYEEFQSYDITKLEKATAENLVEEKKIEDWNLALIESINELD